MFPAHAGMNRVLDVKPYLENIAQIDNRPALQTALQEIA
jgi:hypothetical protein